eukprot:9689617-Ditylum_brightwellii.AAC.1
MERGYHYHIQSWKQQQTPPFNINLAIGYTTTMTLDENTPHPLTASTPKEKLHGWNALLSLTDAERQLTDDTRRKEEEQPYLMMQQQQCVSGR